MKHVGRESIVADGNSTLFFNPGEPYRVSHPVDGGDDCTVLHVHGDLVRQTLAASLPSVTGSPQRLFPFSHAPAHPAWLLRIAELRRHVAAPHRDTLAAEELALRLLTAAVAAALVVRGVRAARRQDTQAEHKRLSDAVRVLLATRFAEPLGLLDLAKLVRSSPYHLARLFRAHTGQSIHAYRTKLRLAAALPALAEGTSDLTALALDIGFSSHSHFSTAFLSHFGLSPGQARRKISTRRLREMSTFLKA